MKKQMLAISAFVAAFGGSSLAWAQESGVYYGHRMMGGSWHGWIFGPFMMLVFLALAVAVIVLVVRWLGGSGAATPPAPSRKTALDILKERFARGEIDQEEFEQRKRVLED